MLLQKRIVLFVALAFFRVAADGVPESELQIIVSEPDLVRVHHRENIPSVYRVSNCIKMATVCGMCSAVCGGIGLWVNNTPAAIGGGVGIFAAFVCLRSQARGIVIEEPQSGEDVARA
jgi:hypothetical protein